MTNLAKSLARCFGAAAVLAAFSPLAASAQSRAGVLQCAVSGNPGMVVVDERALDCVFEDGAGAPPAHYIGHLTNVGANFGVSGPGELVWAVVAASGAVGPGALAGDYVGANGSFAVGAGGGGAVLVGGSDKTFSLQPLAIQVGTGLNVAAGFGSLELQYMPMTPAPRYHHRRHRHHHHHHYHHHHYTK